MELLCKTRAKLTNGKQRKSGKDPRRWQLINIFQDSNKNVIIKLHKKESFHQSVVLLENIVCFEEQTCGILPDSLKEISVLKSGPTPYHKPNRTLSTEEKQKRYDYLIKNHFPENVTSVIERGYSAKDVKRARQKLAKKDPVSKVKILASKEEAIAFLTSKLKK